MRRITFAVAALLLAVPAFGSAGSSYVVPTTTLAAQTSNNTSAANSFATQTNGNRGAGNISKIDIHSLLYAGATTRIYAHMLLWFGESSHMNVGYSSDNATQVQNQIEDMISRGIDGVVIDWYGPNNTIDKATQLVMAAAENHPGFTFAIMIDQGAIEWDSCSGCSPQQALIAQLQYLEQTYFSSPAYMKWQGQPVVTNFNIDLSYSVDWSAANAALSTHPLFIFQNSTGFTHVLSDGSYSWVMPTTTDYGMSYLSNFYDTGMTFANEQTVGAAYKGFNDTLASWGSDRIMNQQCGQTWLQTFSAINNLYSSGKPLPDLQLVTWNDYEEGTELESGIDNCLTISGAVSGSALQWSVNGNENTVDHYQAYISSDGQNLMPLTEIATGIHSLNLCSFPIPAGSYSLFVQAVGKPTLANQITGAIRYNPSCAVPAISPTPTLSFSASPSSVTILNGKTGTFTLVATPSFGSFNNPITLSCSGVPSTLSCSFSPAVITPGAAAATSMITISSKPPSPPTGSPRNKQLPLYPGWLMPIGLAGLAFMDKNQRKRGLKLLVFCALMGLGMVSSSCGGSGASTQNAQGPASNSYAVTIQGNSAAGEISTVVNVIVQ